MLHNEQDLSFDVTVHGTLSSRPSTRDPAERETEGKWRDPDDACTTVPIQGVLPRLSGSAVEEGLSRNTVAPSAHLRNKTLDKTRLSCTINRE